MVHVSKVAVDQITIIKKNEDSLNVFRETFKKQIGKKTSFNKYMEKIKTVLKYTLKKEKRISTGRKRNKIIQAAVYMDTV